MGGMDSCLEIVVFVRGNGFWACVWGVGTAGLDSGVEMVVLDWGKCILGVGRVWGAILMCSGVESHVAMAWFRNELVWLPCGDGMV